ncbi:MAG: hypothetical protein HYX48_06015 [Chlamydiales bacterium]|nr:hypothetical protein [Chlamydiales bacterium]
MTSRVEYATPQDTYVKICECAGSDGLVALSRVSKAFNAASREVIRLLGTKLDQTWDREVTEGSYNAQFSEVLRTQFRGDYARMMRGQVVECTYLIDSALGASYGAVRRVLKERWERLIALPLVEQVNALSNKRRALFFSEFKRELERCQLPATQQWAIARNPLDEYLRTHGEQEAFFALTHNQRRDRSAAIEIERLAIVTPKTGLIAACSLLCHQFYLREIVTRRFESTMRENSTELDPFMRDLRSSASETSVGLQRFQAFRRDPKSLSLEKITEFEEFLLTDLEHNDQRRINFSELRDALSAQQIPFDAHESDESLRSLFATPDLASQIAQIGSLRLLQELSGIPLELRLCKGLRELQIIFEAGCNFTSLDFSAFTELATLTIRNAGLSQLPLLPENGETLSRVVIDQPEPIRVLPDDLARRTQANTFRAFAQDAWFHMQVWNPQAHNSYRIYNLGFMDLPPANLSDIPFFIWFRDNCTAPYIPILDYVKMLASPAKALYYAGDYHLLIPAILFTFPFAFLSPFFFAINLAIFGVNLFLNYAIEPIVTYFRDQLGYSRMVHIRDFPEQGAPL